MTLVKTKKCSKIPTDSAMALRLLFKICLNPVETQVHWSSEGLCGMLREIPDIHGLWLGSSTDNPPRGCRPWLWVACFQYRRGGIAHWRLEPCPLGLWSWSVCDMVQTVLGVTGLVTVVPVGCSLCLFGVTWLVFPGCISYELWSQFVPRWWGSLDSVIRLW